MFANLISISLGDHRIEQATKTSGSQTASKSVSANQEKHNGELNSSERPDHSQDAALQQQKLVEQPVTGQTASSPTVEEVTIPKEELKMLKNFAAGELGNLKVKLAELKGWGVRKEEATFTVEIEGIYCAIDEDSNEELKSETFYFRGKF